ncbi:hypothetical protein [Dongia sp.]|uniref:hypothetical protein n=1 Tax=Dongia sp. TaxID=1977262 RepID=UPI00375379CC
MDEIWLVATLVFAAGIGGFLLGMFALMRARELATHFDVAVPRIPGLSQEQTFGLLGIAGLAGVCLALFLR